MPTAILKELLSPDALKVMYRLNYTKKQAALALGIGVDKLQKEIDKGNIGINLVDGEDKISREECERFLRDRKRYIKTPKVQNV